VKDLVFFSVGICGFMMGLSSRLNPMSVPQRQPNLGWLGMAGLILAGSLVAASENSTLWVCLFALKSAAVFCTMTGLGIFITWVCRKESPLIDD
jgi:FtsH-binding integral membrane protein